MLSSVLMRPDMLPDEAEDRRRGKANPNTQHAKEFVEFSKQVLSKRVDILIQSGKEESKKNLSHLEDNTFETLSTLTTLCLLFKNGDRRLLLPMIEVDEETETETKAETVNDDDNDDDINSKNNEKGLLELLCILSDPPPPISSLAVPPLTRRILTKLFGRIGCTFLPEENKKLDFRYKLGNSGTDSKSLIENLKKGGVKSAESATVEPEGAKAKDVEPEKDLDEENMYVPTQVEDVIHVLLISLRDPSTPVRWSSAKSIGETCFR